MFGEYKFPISECPRCGSSTLTIKQKISGIGEYYVDLKQVKYCKKIFCRRNCKKIYGKKLEIE